MSDQSYIEKLEEENRKVHAENAKLQNSLNFTQHQLDCLVETMRRTQPQERTDVMDAAMARAKRAYAEQQSPNSATIFIKP